MALDNEQIEFFLEKIGDGEWDSVPYLFEYLEQKASENPVYKQYEANLSKWDWEKEKEEGDESRVNWFHRSLNVDGLDYEGVKAFVYGYYKFGANFGYIKSLLKSADQYRFQDLNRELLGFLAKALEDIIKAEPQLEEHVIGSGVTIISNSTIGVLNTGEIQNVKSITTNVTALSKSGHSEVVESLKSLTEAVIASRELSSEQREETLEQLEVLSEQAKLATEGKAKRGIVKPILTSLAATLGAAGGLAEVWSTWGDTIQKFFQSLW